MFQLNQPLLINILGHAAGALIFAIFLCLLFSRRGWSGSRGRFLSGLAAALSLAWNLGSLLVLAWPGLPPHTLDLLAAFSFSVLSLLPAVLLQVSLDGRWPALATAGYGLSGVVIILHWREIYTTGGDLHQIALLLTTVGFLLLTAVAVVAAVLERGSGRGAPWARRSPHRRVHVPGPVRHVVPAFRSWTRTPGLVERAGGPPRRNSAGPVRAAAGLPLRAAGRLHALPGQRPAGRRADLAGDRGRLSPAAGAKCRRSAGPSHPADQRVPVPGVFRVAAQSRPGLAHARRISPRRPRSGGRQHQGRPGLFRRRRIFELGRLPDGLDRAGRSATG